MRSTPEGPELPGSTALIGSSHPNPSEASTPQPADAGSLDPSRLFGGHRLIRRLGRGGFAEVWEAERSPDGRRVALKVLRSHHGLNEDLKRRFQNEGRVAASLSHPRVVYVFSADVVEGHAVITMELVPGGTLQDRLDKEGPMPPQAAADAILDVIEGLEAAQRLGITHRDVKPSNCFVDASGRIKIGDFGIARSAEFSAVKTATGVFVGTPAFASPEQFRGQRADHRSDLYGVGATLYALLTNHPPFEAAAVGELLARIVTQPPVPFSKHGVRVHRTMRGVVYRLLAKDPQARYPTYGALASALTPLSTRDTLAPDIARRFGAYLVDLILSTSLVSVIFSAISGVGVLEWVQRPTMSPYLFAAGGFAVPVVLFSLFEWLWRRTPGKRLFGLYVVSTTGAPCTPGQALLRNLSFWALHNSLGWVALFGPDWIAPLSVLGAALPCVSMRSANGFAGLHEIWTATGVRAARGRSTEHSQITTEDPALDPTGSETGRETYRGPYRPLGEAWRTDRDSLVIAFDDQLSRRVWIHESASPGDASAIRAEAAHRPGRLQWLQGGSVEGCRWDAYEAPFGMTLPQYVSARGSLGWSETREILLELLSETAASIDAGDLPERISLHHLWIDGNAHLKVLGFPAAAAGDEGAHVEWHWNELHRAVALLCLEGAVPGATRSVTEPPRAPLPGQARAFLATLIRDPLDPTRLRGQISKLRDLSLAPASVSRSVRLTQLLCAWSLPGVIASGAFLGVFGSLLARPHWDQGIAGLAVAAAAGLDIAMVVLCLIAIPSLLAAYLFRGGPLLYLFGMQAQRSDGAAASRARCLLRATIAMLPILLISVPVWMLTGFGALAGRSPVGTDQTLADAWARNIMMQIETSLTTGLREVPEALRIAMLLVGACLAVLFLVGVFLSVLNPSRGIQDQIAGTRLMPR
jgi:eukaryotic-like serine/threonine-protein kinase